MVLTDRATWQVPTFTETVLTEKRHNHALVIPVINEGDRVRHQLGLIAQFVPPVDVVIADGGSTDGSLELDFLRNAGVRTLLIKTGAGRLSAQLRMAYAWCLDAGYDGIGDTMDGNGKDSVEFDCRLRGQIGPRLRLCAGFALPPRREQLNYPIDRYIAGRLIHAPIFESGRTALVYRHH